MNMKNNGITEYFTEVETEQEYKGYFYSVAQALTIFILGSLCGLKNVSQIHQWAVSAKVSEFLKEEFGIKRIPCYYWLLKLLQLVKTDSLNEYFRKWVQTMIPEDMVIEPLKDGKARTSTIRPMTIAVDGKTIRSTEKMEGYESPLHVVSAQLAELGLTFAQKAVEDKSNEIPTVQSLLQELEISGCMIVADALNCQKATANIIVKKKADYLLVVKGNQGRIYDDIKTEVQEHEDKFQKAVTEEKNRGRIETRIGYVSSGKGIIKDIGLWPKLTCLGAICRIVQKRKKGSEEWGVSEEWHYYISSRNITAEELLHHARMEWSVESMHWLLDVHFGEDCCRIADKNGQKNLNILRKSALNLVKSYKLKYEPKRPMSKIMFDCLLEPKYISKIIPCGGETQ